MTTKVKFPDGREVDINEVISFLYGLGTGEVQVLHSLLSKGGKYTADQLAEELRVSKTSVNKALNNLFSKGLIEREKIIEEGKKGRPVYVYWVNKEIISKKMAHDLFTLITNTRDVLKKTLTEREKIVVKV